MKTGEFERELFAQAQNAQRLREGADYDARAVAGDEAVAVVAQAERFVSTIEALLGS